MSDWLTVAEAADYLRVSVNTIRRRCDAGTFTRLLNVGTEKRRVYRIHRDCLELSVPAKPVARKDVNPCTRGYERAGNS